MGMREDLNAALDSTANDDDTQNYEETPQEVLETETDIEEVAVADNDDGEPTTVPDTVDETDPAPDKAAEPVTEANAETAPEESSTLGPNDSIKAPVNWGPKERESWSKIPRNLQEKVMAREKEVNMLMQNTAEARKTHEEFGKLTQQYGAVLSGIAGNNPVEVAGNLFNTVANLRMGSPIQKAQIIADMINDFGVDINTLDSAIVGQAPPPEQQENQRIEQMVAQRLAPFEQMMGQQNAYAEQQKAQQQEAANNEVATFAQNAEFFNDVRQDMADLVDMADKRGYPMSMQEAYDKACALKPEIQSVLAERQQRQSLMASNNSIASKRNAASSVNGQQIGGGGGSGGMSMRDTIASAWDSQGRV